MYEIDPDGRLYFLDNTIDRYAISDRTPNLRSNGDGTLTIVIQHDPPSASNNWLPSPSGRFALALRLYLPSPSFLAGAWRLPAVRRVG